MVAQNPIHLCWICARDVSLETSKTDEQGYAVHEECYVLRMSLQQNVHDTFEEWKTILESDCIMHDKLVEFDILSDSALRLLYENGTGPSMAAIIRDRAGKRESPQS